MFSAWAYLSYNLVPIAILGLLIAQGRDAGVSQRAVFDSPLWTEFHDRSTCCASWRRPLPDTCSSDRESLAVLSPSPSWDRILSQSAVYPYHRSDPPIPRKVAKRVTFSGWPLGGTDYDGAEPMLFIRLLGNGPTDMEAFPDPGQVRGSFPLRPRREAFPIALGHMVPL